MQIGNKLKSIRKKKGISQKELAIQTGISPSFLSDIEKGRSNPSYQNLQKICHVLDLQPSYFIADETSSKNTELYNMILEIIADVKTWDISDQQELYSYLKAKQISKQ